jgi:hypothetical protein
VTGRPRGNFTVLTHMKMSLVERDRWYVIYLCLKIAKITLPYGDLIVEADKRSQQHTKGAGTSPEYR